MRLMPSSERRRSGPRRRVLFKSGDHLHSGDLFYQDKRPVLVVTWRTIGGQRVPYISFPLDRRRLKEADRQANTYRYEGPLFSRPRAANEVLPPETTEAEETPSTGPDAGSRSTLRSQTFRGRLDVLERRAPSRQELPALAPTRRLRILVVEDNRDSADSLRKLLELCGYAVTVAYTGDEGLEAALRTPPDVVLCDIALPDRDGFSVATALRRHPSTSNARLIAVTAYGSAEDQKRSHDAGFQLHLVKPVRPDTLLEQLDPNDANRQRH
jgi:CheY-like chemotaxis protein